MIYIVTPQVNYSGNLVTAKRISNFFYGCQVIGINELFRVVKEDIIIGLHAYKVGKDLINKNFNFFIILTGTDLNCDFYDNQKKDIILEVFKQSKKIIVFNQYQKDIIKKFNFESIIIPQSVSNNLPINNFNLRSYLNLPIDSKVYLLVGNMRKIKDPFFLINEFKKLHDDFSYNFIYIGSNLDSYDISHYWIKHINGLDQKSTYSAISQSNGLINTSIGEGMSSTILEAMSLKCPVYARINNSNEYIIKDNYNGYLFDNKKDFLNKIIKEDNDFIINNAYNEIKNIYCHDKEKKEYHKLIKKIENIFDC